MCWRNKSLDEVQIRLEGINLGLKVATLLAAAASYLTLAASGQTGVWIPRIDLPSWYDDYPSALTGPCLIFSSESFKKTAFQHQFVDFDAKLSLGELRLTGSEIEDNCALMYDLETSDNAFSEEMDVDSLLEDCGVSTAYWRLMIFAFLFVLIFQATGFISKACKTQCGKKKLEVSKVQFWNSCSFQPWDLFAKARMIPP